MERSTRRMGLLVRLARREMMTHIMSWRAWIRLLRVHTKTATVGMRRYVVRLLRTTLYDWRHHVLQVAGCCSVLQCVAVCCRVLQCVAACCRVLQSVAVSCCSVLQQLQQGVAVVRCSSVLHQRVAAVCCSIVLQQCCSSVLQHT